MFDLVIFFSLYIKFLKNQDGFISKNELQEIMGGINLDDKTWNDFIKQNDQNSDGKVLKIIF